MNSLNRDPELSRGDGTDGIIGTTNAIQQLEVLLTNKLKSLESELTETRRELQNSRLQEVNRTMNSVLQ